ncbi:hypothetical protein FHR36_001430 [Kitasatospora paracochleata]|uniref:Uncharacterized protein n=1 Tax=Kitasatospora paracochleata TaxID=58354 RepID=A0ABT1IUN8_9ACTN|nr:hypothetical protein [Kitasatospora paracochleata]
MRERRCGNRTYRAGRRQEGVKGVKKASRSLAQSTEKGRFAHGPTPERGPQVRDDCCTRGPSPGQPRVSAAGSYCGSW